MTLCVLVGNCCGCNMERGSYHSASGADGWLLVLASNSRCVSALLHIDKTKGGERPRTSAYNSEILQSESLAEVSCPISSIIDPFLGRPNSHMSNDAYKLKVEKLKTDVLGRTGG